MEAIKKIHKENNHEEISRVLAFPRWEPFESDEFHKNIPDVNRNLLWNSIINFLRIGL